MRSMKYLLIVLSLLSQILLTEAILLDIHVPLPQGCLLTQALRANLALQQVNHLAGASSNDSGEAVDLFTKDIPHVTLYLADFDLEATPQNTTTPTILNQTKVDSFLKTIGLLNFTKINASSCPLSFVAETSSSSFFSINNEKYYVINGAYTMIPVKNNECLQHLSDSLLSPLQKYLKLPSSIPSWVNDLPEETRKEKIEKITSYGSPNVLENFEPHVTVGYDKHTTQRRLQECSNGQCLDLQGQCQPEVSCFADPCTEVPGEKCRDGEVCRANFCGGCNFGCETLSVGESGAEMSQLRVDAMEDWNDHFQLISDECNGRVLGVGVGRTGLGGTVLSGSRLGYWELFNDEEDGQLTDTKKIKEMMYARVEE